MLAISQANLLDSFVLPQTSFSSHINTFTYLNENALIVLWVVSLCVSFMHQFPVFIVF